MRKINQKGLAVLMLAAVLVLVTTTQAFAAPQMQGANLVKNPSFEGGTYVADSVGDMRVPNSWEAFNLSSAKMHYEAEPHPNHVHSGTYSARYFSSWEKHNAGLRQKITGLTPGATYRLSGYVFMWSTDNAVVDTPSEGFMTGYLGADPTGGKDPASANVKWTSYRQMDQFLLLTIDVVPTTSEMWIFLRSTNEYALTRNDAFWDDISLTLVSATTTTPGATAQPTTGTGTGAASVRVTPDAQGRIIHTVAAGDTLSGIAFMYGVTMDQIQQLNGMTSNVVLLGTQLIISNGTVVPTAAPTSAATEGPTAEPTAMMTATPIPAAPGKLCVISFLDENGNGFREPEEKGAPGITFSLNEGTTVLASNTTDAAGSLCFETLEPANYSITWTQAEYTPTTDQTWAANLSEGVTLNHEFGLQSILAADDVEAESAPRSGLPGWAVALIGALGGILLLAGLGAGGYFLLAKRKV